MVNSSLLRNGKSFMKDKERMIWSAWTNLSDLGYNVGSYDEFCLTIEKTFAKEKNDVRTKK